MTLDAALAAIDGTWPAARYVTLGPVTLREGRGGGSRVSAATVAGAWAEADLDHAISAMEGMGQVPLFMVRPGQDGLDQALEARGFEVFAPVTLWSCPVSQLTDLKLPRVTAFPHWEPLAIAREIWAGGDIGPERVEVMSRVTGPKAAILMRTEDKPAGVGFVACDSEVAMVHAVEIRSQFRRKGLGAWLMRAAAIWAAGHGATRLTVLCTRANTAANGLYASLGMDAACGYHYRIQR